MKTPLNKNRFWQMGILTLLIGSASQVAFADSYWECQCVKEDVDALQAMTLNGHPVSCKNTVQGSSLIDSDGNAIEGAELKVTKSTARIRLTGDELTSTGTSSGKGTYDVGASSGYHLNWLKDANNDDSKKTLSGDSFKSVTTTLASDSPYEYTLGKLDTEKCAHTSSIDGSCDDHYFNDYHVSAIWQTSSQIAAAVCMSTGEKKEVT